jgi:GT2 family glycosyltransferase
VSAFGDTPLVSVVTPCYNAAPFIAETIGSVQAQQYPRIEHIIVDDGSTDASWSIIQSAVPRVTAMQLERNCGGGRARNQGAACARGMFLLFLDADDLLSPDAVGSLVAAVQDRPATIGVCRWHRLRQDRGSGWSTQSSEIPFPPPADALKGWLEGIWVPPCAVLWRRTDYERIGGWDETLLANQDGDLMMRALAANLKLAVADGGEAWYRAHGDARLSVSTTRIMTPEKLRSHARVLDKLAVDLEAQGQLARYTEPLGMAYHSLALVGFQQGHHQLARVCLERGVAYAGVRPVSRTRAGRFLARLLGVEAKERMLSWLAQWGVATSARRRQMSFRASRPEAASPKQGDTHGD